MRSRMLVLGLRHLCQLLLCFLQFLQLFCLFLLHASFELLQGVDVPGVENAGEKRPVLVYQQVLHFEVDSSVL